MGMGRTYHFDNSKEMLWSANGIISVCNALGAYMASYGGLWVKKTTFQSEKGQSVLLYLSSFAFGVLALMEYQGYKQGGEAGVETTIPKKRNKDDGPTNSPQFEKSSTMTRRRRQQQNLSSIWKLAIPMTLNNLAGGVVGGATGVTPELLTFSALIISFITLWVGYELGRRMTPILTQRSSWMHPSLLSAILLGSLCLMTLREAMYG